jgi:hypothetical protein
MAPILRHDVAVPCLAIHRIIIQLLPYLGAPLLKSCLHLGVLLPGPFLALFNDMPNIVVNLAWTTL